MLAVGRAERGCHRLPLSFFLSEKRVRTCARCEPTCGVVKTSDLAWPETRHNSSLCWKLHWGARRWAGLLVLICATGLTIAAPRSASTTQSGVKRGLDLRRCHRLDCRRAPCRSGPSQNCRSGYALCERSSLRPCNNCAELGAKPLVWRKNGSERPATFSSLVLPIDDRRSAPRTSMTVPPSGGIGPAGPGVRGKSH